MTQYETHLSAALIVAAFAGSARLTLAMRPRYGPQWRSQLFLVMYAIGLLVAVYLVPEAGVLILGFVLPFTAEHHFRAWVVEVLGPEAVLKRSGELLGARGPARYAAAAAAAPLLHSGTGVVIILMASDGPAWAGNFGKGLVLGGLVAILADSKNVWQHWRAVKSLRNYGAA